jgi:hypothetical protein
VAVAFAVSAVIVGAGLAEAGPAGAGPAGFGFAGFGFAAFGPAGAASALARVGGAMWLSGRRVRPAGMVASVRRAKAGGTSDAGTRLGAAADERGAEEASCEADVPDAIVRVVVGLLFFFFACDI